MTWFILARATEITAIESSWTDRRPWSQMAEPGNLVTYAVTVTNNGTQALSQMKVSGSSLLEGFTSCSIPTTLAPGADFICYLHRTKYAKEDVPADEDSR